MTNIPSEKQYILDRKMASRLLKISTRTLDRYIKAKKMSTRVIGGRIWLNKEEVAAFKDLKDGYVKVEAVDMSIPKMTIDENGNMVDEEYTTSQNSVESMSTERRKKSNFDDEIYKKLYLELKEELKEKQLRLEIANYRVGQLESQVKNSIPLLEYHSENYKRKMAVEDMENKIKDSEMFSKTITNQLKLERLNKRIFIIILLTILALQPLWLLLFYK